MSHAPASLPSSTYCRACLLQELITVTTNSTLVAVCSFYPADLLGRVRIACRAAAEVPPSPEPP